MADVHIPKPDATTSQQIGAKVAELIEAGHELYATSVTSNPAGRTRRPTLFVVAAIGTIVGTQLLLGAVVAIIAIMLLALTDAVVEL